MSDYVRYRLNPGEVQRERPHGGEGQDQEQRDFDQEDAHDREKRGADNLEGLREPRRRRGEYDRHDQAQKRPEDDERVGELDA